MDMVSVSSSQISAVGYDPETMEARVEFTNGSVYSYQGVPMGITDEIIKSESPGRTFSATLKFGFTYSRIS
jgi:KTSC domain